MDTHAKGCLLGTRFYILVYNTIYYMYRFSCILYHYIMYSEFITYDVKEVRRCFSRLCNSHVGHDFLPGDSVDPASADPWMLELLRVG